MSEVVGAPFLERIIKKKKKRQLYLGEIINTFYCQAKPEVFVTSSVQLDHGAS